MAAKKKFRKDRPPVKDEDGLTPRQRAFVRAYQEDPNGIRAATKAGYTGNRDTIAATASRLKALPHIAKVLAREEGREIFHSLLRREARAILLAKIASGEIDDWIDDGGGAVPGRAKLKDKIRALEILGKMGGDFVERREVTGLGGGPQEHRVVLTLEQMIAGARDGSIPGEGDDDGV